MNEQPRRQPPRPCATDDPQAVRDALAVALRDGGWEDDLSTSHPHLFSTCAIELPESSVQAMQATINAVEQVVATPGWQQQALAAASATARHDPRCHGVFLGYDFHITPDGPRLIEINTNAGGALLALAITRAHLACTPARAGEVPFQRPLGNMENEFATMFRHEWRLARGEFPLRRIAIVDESPAAQYLYPEFVLFQNLFRRHGLETVIAGPEELSLRDNRLRHTDGTVDLIYNRLTDFALESPAHATLRSAWLDDLAVFTPHPRAHALYANKRNLVWLTQPDTLRALGVDAAAIDRLQAGVGRTRPVTPDDAESLWAARKQLFFKPLSGFGSKAVYRGDKLTKRVWEEILASDYVAQELAVPGEAQAEGDAQSMKYDVRCFVYAGQIQLLAARLYQGQTTNFRTVGGGFAPVFVSEAT
jgi:hypothetical protein